jgi:hypothetical protein
MVLPDEGDRFPAAVPDAPSFSSRIFEFFTADTF